MLLGNVGQIMGGIQVFAASRPDDGRLELGVLTAKSAAQWARTLGRVATGRAEKSPFVRTTQGTSFDIRFRKPMIYELDGGTRPAAKRLRVRVRPASVTVCVPDAS